MPTNAEFDPPPPQDIAETVMPILMVVEEQLRMWGTAFVIHSLGLLLTARHVVESALDSRKLKYVHGTGDVVVGSLYAMYQTHRFFGATKNAPVSLMLPVKDAWEKPGQCDIAVIEVDSLHEGQRVPLPALPLSPGLPRVGDNVIGIGYYSASGSLTPQTGKALYRLDYNHKMGISPGRITAVYPSQRPVSHQRFPCFSTTAQINGGMSGGPIYNEAEHVCGVMSAGTTYLDGKHEDEGDWGALLWNAMLIQPTLQVNRGVPPEPITLYEMARRKMIDTDESINRLIQIKDANGHPMMAMIDRS